MIVLAGDIGGTNARIALVDMQDGAGTILRREVYESDRFSGLGDIVLRFLADTGATPEYAGFGVPCPVRDRPCKLANLDWVIDPAMLARQIGIPKTVVVNDFEAIAHAIPLLGKDDLETIYDRPAHAHGTIAILGAGTGLGMAFLYWDGHRWDVLPSEGGHADFAPRNEFEIELLMFWRKRLGRVSWERFLAGPGFLRIYQFITESGRIPASPDVQAAMAEDDPAAVITRHALDQSDAACAAALEHFVSIFGAAAGNVSLIARATGGVYLAGGIAPRISKALRTDTFLRAYHDMGRLSYIPKNAPVHIITNPHTGLIGAAQRSLNG